MILKKFRDNFGSLGQMCLGLAKCSVEGLTKVPPFFFSKFRSVSGSLGRICLGLPRGSSWTSKSFCTNFQQGFPRLYRGSSKVLCRLRKVRVLSGLLGEIFFGYERLCRGFPHHFFIFCLVLSIR